MANMAITNVHAIIVHRELSFLCWCGELACHTCCGVQCSCVIIWLVHSAARVPVLKLHVVALPLQGNLAMANPKPKSKANKGKEIGQAPALPMKLWKEWLQWLKEHAGPTFYMVILLTGALGLRCGEALCLKGKDINLEAAIPKATITGESQGGKTSPGDVYVRQQHVQLLRRILKHGINITRCK